MKNFIEKYAHYLKKYLKDNYDFIQLYFTNLDQIKEFSEKPQENPEYFQEKIDNVREHFDIEDPKISREKFYENIVYIKQKDKYFDLSTNEEYSDRAINFTYAKFFDKSPTLYLKRNPQRIVVEDWIYNPKEYDPNNRVLKYDC